MTDKNQDPKNAKNLPGAQAGPVDTQQNNNAPQNQPQPQAPPQAPPQDPPQDPSAKQPTKQPQDLSQNVSPERTQVPSDKPPDAAQPTNPPLPGSDLNPGVPNADPGLASMAASSALKTFPPKNREQADKPSADLDINTTAHSGADSVASLDLTPPGAPPAQAGNVVTRGIGSFFSAIFGIFKRIPPIEDIFDMCLGAMGFQRKATSMLRRAQSLAAKGRHAEAIKWFKDILYLRPLTIAAYDGLGRVYFRMGLTEDANREFTIADSLERLVNNRDDLDAACSLAKAFLESKQAKMAVSLLEPVLIAHFYHPNNNELLKKMGALYNEIRATKKLSQVYEAGLIQHPDDHEFYILKGNLDIKFGRVSEGEKLIRWGRLMGRLKDNPSDINANMAFGELCIKENKIPEGLSYLRAAAALSPENSGIRWRLFNLYQKQGQYDEALRYFLEVIAIEPENEELLYKLADFYRKNHHYDDALDIFRKLSDKHPRDPRPRSCMASLLNEMGQYEEAQNAKALADTLTIGLKAEPDHRETVIFMKYLFSINQNEEGVEWLNRGLVKWPYHGELIIAKVKILYNEYRYKEAVNLLKRLISVKHDMAEPHMWIALCYQRLGNHMAALAESQLATRLAPKSFTCHKVLGDILKEQKKISQANAAYEVADMIRLSQTKAVASGGAR
ncbi:MAG: tetratricopeptide repeat protein [Deltaproteobacteria bacterium]|jgi:tetratricopeptide (TPR) repeat protein|nr:tetratricopeptide repeat protein [Deltaproteobacteria bacterium]